MRGLAVLLAAASGWVIVTGVLPRFRWSLPVVGLRELSAALGVFAISSVIVHAALGVPTAALVIAALLASVPITAAAQRRAAVRAARRDAWPDILGLTRTSLSAGVTLEDAFCDALDHIGGSGSDDARSIRHEVAFGRGFAAAMEQMRQDHADPTSDRIAVTLETASSSGGTRVGQIVGLLADSVAAELQLRKQHDAALTEQRWTVNVALAAPWVLLALSIATNPQAADAFASTTGSVVIVVGFVATVIGWAMARRSARLAAVPRVFR